MLEIQERFDIPAEPSARLGGAIGPPRGRRLRAGASIVGEDEDGSLDTSVVVEFGPTRVTFGRGPRSSWTRLRASGG